MITMKMMTAASFLDFTQLIAATGDVFVSATFRPNATL